LAGLSYIIYYFDIYTPGRQTTHEDDALMTVGIDEASDRSWRVNILLFATSESVSLKGGITMKAAESTLMH